MEQIPKGSREDRKVFVTFDLFKSKFCVRKSWILPSSEGRKQQISTPENGGNSALSLYPYLKSNPNMSILYINPLGKALCLKIFSLEGQVLHEEMIAKNNDEFSFFPELLTKLTEKYVISEIWCVIGPGPFTLMRIITLAINSIAYTKNIPLKSCHFFELITSGNIPIIEANTREFLIRGNDNNTQQIDKEKLPFGRYEGIFGEIDFTDGKTFIEYKEDSDNIWKVFMNKDPENRISPLYYKPPHITGGKTILHY